MANASEDPSALGRIWTEKTYQQSCRESGGKIIQKTEDDRAHFECRKQAYEISSAWFSKSRNKMLGWLERSRNSEGVLVKDTEFREDGQIKEQVFYIKTEGDRADKIQNLFVFNGKNELVRGNLTIDKDTYLIATPELVFKNGSKISIDEVSKKLSARFKQVPDKSLYKLVDKIWKLQNIGKAQGATSPEGSSTR